jgi:signal transduction histidine kinase
MIERLLENLIDNALKFTPSGGTVRVEVRAAPQTDAIDLTVTDSGCGIADEDLPRIFERFERGRAAARGEVVLSGSGLGLAIVRRIIELHGAQIAVASRLGEGTRFSARFPPCSRGAT